MADFDPDAYLKDFSPKAQPAFDPEAYLSEFASKSTTQGPSSTSPSVQVSVAGSAPTNDDSGVKEIPYPSDIPAGPSERTPQELRSYLDTSASQFDEGALGRTANAVRSAARGIGKGVASGVKGIIEQDPAAIYSRMDEQSRKDLEKHLDDQLSPAQEVFAKNPDAKNPLTGKYVGDEIRELQRQKLLVDRGRQISGTMDDPKAWEQALKPEELQKAYAIDPKLEHTKLVAAANIAGGIGGFVGEGLVHPALPLIQMISSASSEAGDSAVETAKANGEKDETKLAQIRDHASAHAAKFAAATIPIYMAGGKLASTAGKAIASPIVKALTETGVSAASNVAIGAGMRRLENGKWELPTGEQVSQDVGWAFLHGIHALTGATEKRAAEKAAFEKSIQSLSPEDFKTLTATLKSVPDTDSRKVALEQEIIRRDAAPTQQPPGPAGAPAQSEAQQAPVVQSVSQEQGGTASSFRQAQKEKADAIRSAITPEAKELAPATAAATEKAADTIETPPKPEHEEILFPSDTLAFRGGETTKWSDAKRVRKIVNDAGKTVYSIVFGPNGEYMGYSDNPVWELHEKFQETPSKAEVETPASGHEAQSIADEEGTPAPKTEASKETAPVEPQNLVPSIETPDGVKTGDSHQEIINRERLPQEVKESPKAGFKDTATGDILSREEAAAETGLPTNKEEGKLHSSDLPKPEEVEHAKKGLAELESQLGDEEPPKRAAEMSKEETLERMEKDLAAARKAGNTRVAKDIRTRIKALSSAPKSEPEEPPSAEQPKELWEKTRDQIKSEDGSLARHRLEVRAAVKDGKQVPLEVLEGYAGSAWADKAIQEQHGGKASDSLLSRVEKALENDPAKLYADPLLIQAIGKPVLRQAVKIIREGIESGKLVKDAIEDAMTYLRSNVKDLDEEKARTIFGNLEPPKPVEYVMPDRAEKHGDKAVTVDIGKFEPVFAKDTGFYVSPTGEGAIAGRLQGVKDFLKTGKPVEMPEVSVGDDGSVAFTNGRHRYAVLRDQGEKTIPMAMSPESASNAEKFGLTQKTEGGDSVEKRNEEKGQKEGVLTRPREGDEVPSSEPEPDTTSLKRAVVDEQRRGEEIPTPTRQPIDQVINEARQRIAENPTVAPELISRIVDRGETAVSREDAATVLAERRRVINERNQWEDTLGRADAPEAQRDLARVKLAEIQQQMDRLDQASRAAGSAWSDVGRMYQVDLKADFSREALERKERSVRGRPLTEAESNKIKKQAAEITRLKKEVEREQKTKRDLAEAQEVSRAYEKTIADLRKQTGKKAPEPIEKRLTKPLSEQIVSLAKSARESALARIKARKGKLFADPIGVMSALDLADHAIVGATHLIEGSVTFGKWSKKMVEDFGNGVKPHLRTLFDASKAQAAKMLDKPEKTPLEIRSKAKAEAVAGEPLSHKTVYELARAHIAAGVRGEDNVMSAVHSDIQKAYTDASERDVRRAFSDYGKVKFPSKEEVEKELRETRTLVRLQESIDRETEGLQALHTGLQRDKATQAIREKQKQLNELLKARQSEPSPEKLASREEAKQTALRNAIADLDKQLRTGEAPEKRAPTPDSPATEQLRSELGAMREKLREIEAEPPKSEEQKQVESLEKTKQRLDDTLSGKLDPKKPKDFTALSQRAEDIKSEILAMQELARQMRKDALPPKDPGAYSEKRQIDALEKAIERYSKKTADKDFSPTTGKKLGPDSLKVSQLKEIRHSRREMYEAVKGLGKVVKTPDEIYNERRMKDIAKRIDELEARKKAGDFAPRQKPPPKVKTPETKRAEVKLAQAEEDIARGWARLEDANRPKWKKALEQVAGAARFSALSGYHTLAKLAGYDVSKFLAQPLQEGAGAILQRTPGLRGVFNRSTMEKTDFSRDMKNFYAGAAVKGMKQAARVLREGKTESGLLHGKKEHLNPKWYDFIGRLHYAEKAPLVTGTEEMYLARAYDAAIRDGLDPNDEFVKAEINRAVWEHSQASILQENNKFAEAVNGLHTRLEAANPKSKNLEITNQVISTLVKTLLTKGIVRTPANYIAQTIKSTPIGLVTGLAKAAVANHRGIGNLHPAEANAISRLIKVGAVGSAMFLLGAIDATKKKEDRTFGGYWEPGRTRDGKDVDWGTMRIDGHQIPHLVTHNPLTESAQMGSTMMRVALSKLRKRDQDEQGLTAGAVKAIIGLATKAPIASPLMRAGEMRGDFMGDMVAGLVPQLIQNIAEDTDPYESRAPVTTEEKLKATIPGLREGVPLPKKPRLKATR